MLQSNKYRIFSFYFSKLGVVHQTGRLNGSSTSLYLKDHMSEKRLFTSYIPCSNHFGFRFIGTQKYSSQCSTHFKSRLCFSRPFKARACISLSHSKNFLKAKSLFSINDHIKSFHSKSLDHSDGSSDKNKNKSGPIKNPPKQGSRGSQTLRNTQKVRLICRLVSI